MTLRIYFCEELTIFFIISDFIIWDFIALRHKMCYNHQSPVIYRNTMAVTQIWG